MARQSAASLLDGDEDVAGNTPRAAPQSDAVWDRAGEDTKRAKRGEPPLTDDEWNEMRADENGEIIEGKPHSGVEIISQGRVDVEEIELLPEAPKTPRSSRKPKEDLLGEAPAKAPAKPKGGKKTDAAVKAAADRAEAAHEAKKSGGKAPGLPGAVDPKALADKTEETKKRRGRKPKNEEAEPAEKVEKEDAVRQARSGNTIGDAGGRLLSFVQRVENLEEEVKSAQTDIKEVFMEAKGEGFDVKVIRRIVKTRKMGKDKMDEEDSLFDLYMMAIENAETQEEGN